MTNEIESIPKEKQMNNLKVFRVTTYILALIYLILFVSGPFLIKDSMLGGMYIWLASFTLFASMFFCGMALIQKRIEKVKRNEL